MSIEDGKVVVVWMLARSCVCRKASELAKPTRELWKSVALPHKPSTLVVLHGCILLVCPVYAFVTIRMKNHATEPICADRFVASRKDFAILIH